MAKSMINHSYWSYVHRLSYRKRGAHFENGENKSRNPKLVAEAARSDRFPMPKDGPKTSAAPQAPMDTHCLLIWLAFDPQKI